MSLERTGRSRVSGQVQRRLSHVANAEVSSTCLGRVLDRRAPARGEGKKKEKKDEAKAVIAVFAFDGPILEKPQGEEFPLFSTTRRPALKDLVERMKKAKDDKNVKAVVLLLDEVAFLLSQSEELRSAWATSKKRARKCTPMSTPS